MTSDNFPLAYLTSKCFISNSTPILLEQLHPNLCAACQNATLCSSNDEFAGDDGTLRCLFSGYGQVAFTTSRTVERYLLADRLDRRLVNNFVYLCLDGSKLPLDTGRPCEWAHKPTNVFVTAPHRSSTEKELYLNFLQLMFARFVPYKPSWWQMRSLFSDPAHVTNILPLPAYLQKWSDYLGNYISSIEKPLPLCELNSVTMCTSTPSEELKCLDLQKAAFSLRIRPEIDCRRKASKRECLETVARRQADLASVDLSDLYEAPQELIGQLEPVAVTQGFTDYSVALVRADSGIKFLYQLAGRRSCHASFGDTASWLAPLSVLTERSLLDQKSCNKADQMSEYFGGSCVPGASDLRVNYYRSGYEKLCAICRGDAHQLSGTHQCERSHSERYFGQTGALRCLVEGAGDVAFMSLLSLAANVDGRSQEPWARNVPLAMDSRNFRLICRTGPSMALNNYERCHLARLPGRILVSSKFKSKEDRTTSRFLLSKLAEKFGPNSANRELFQLFGPYMNESDLLFDDSTSNIATLQLDHSTFDQMTQQHFDPSFQQLPVTHKETSCKLVLTTSGTVSRLLTIPANIGVTFLIPTLMLLLLKFII